MLPGVDGVGERLQDLGDPDRRLLEELMPKLPL
jgi:hypothetical protein